MRISNLCRVTLTYRQLKVLNKVNIHVSSFDALVQGNYIDHRAVGNILISTQNGKHEGTTPESISSFPQAYWLASLHARASTHTPQTCTDLSNNFFHTVVIMEMKFIKLVS